MGIGHSANSQNLQKLQSRFRILDQEPDSSIFYLVEKRTNQEFILRQLISNQENNTNIIERIVDEKLHNPSPYVSALRQSIFQKSAGYCSYKVKAFLIFDKSQKTLRTDIIQRKVRGVPYGEQELLALIEAGTQGMRYLNEIGNQHPSISSSTIFVGKDGNYLLSDPWMTPQQYKVSDHVYDSPEKFEQKLSVKPQKIDCLASNLFSLGMVVLECSTMEYLDDVYERNRGLNYTLLNSRISSIRWPSVKSYVSGLLGSEQKRLKTIHEVQAFIISQRHKHSAGFPTIERVTGRLQLSNDSNILKSNVAQTESRISKVPIQCKVEEVFQQRQTIKRIDNISIVLNHAHEAGNSLRKVVNGFSEVRSQNSSSKKTGVQGSQTIEYNSQVNITGLMPQKLQIPKQRFNNPSTNIHFNPNLAHLGKTNSTLSTTKHSSSYSKLPSVHLEKTVQASSTDRLPKLSNQQQVSALRNSIQLSHHQQSTFRPLQVPHLPVKLNQNATQSMVLAKSEPLSNSPSESSMVKSSNLQNSIGKFRSTVQVETEMPPFLQNSLKANERVGLISNIFRQENQEVTGATPITPLIPNFTPRAALSPFSSSFIPNVSMVNSQSIPSNGVLSSVQLSKEFSFAPIASPDKNTSFGTVQKSTQVDTANSKDTFSLNKVNSSGSNSIKEGQQKQEKMYEKEKVSDRKVELRAQRDQEADDAQILLDNFQFQIKYQDICQPNSFKKQKEEISFSHINNVTKLLKMEFQDENISTIEPQRDTVKTPERSREENMTYINPFLQEEKEREKERAYLELHSNLDNIRDVVSFQQKRSEDPRRFNSTIIEVDDEDQSVVSNAETQHVSQQFIIGSRYEGLKKNGKRNGYGVFTYNNGGHYDGNWKNNQMHGQGKLFYKSGALAYDGEWYKDMFHGKGKVFNDPANFSTLQGNSKVEFNYNNLSDYDDMWQYYQGDLRKDQKDGFGTMKYYNGEVFEGEFKEDMIDGRGRFTRLSGEIITGIWRNSILERIL